MAPPGSSSWTLEAIEGIARDLYRLPVQARPLPGYLDCNYLLETREGARFVLKVSPPCERLEWLHCQNRVLEHLARGPDREFFPRLLPAADGSRMAQCADPEGIPRMVRLFTFLAGRPLARVRPVTAALLRQVGDLLGRLDAQLACLEEPAARRYLDWDLARAEELAPQVWGLAQPGRLSVEKVLERFVLEVKPALEGLRRSLIHNDANDYNVLVRQGEKGPSVSGLLDFGDLIHSCTLFEVAVACAYAMMGREDPLGAAAALLEGYQARWPLREDELELLDPLIRLRLAVSLIHSGRCRKQDPENTYLSISEKPAWRLLAQLESVHPELAHCTFRQACGLEPSRRRAPVLGWLGRRREPAPLLECGLDSVEVVDLGVGSLQLRDPLDQEALSRELPRLLEEGGARVAVGRYGETRLFYRAGHYRQAGAGAPRWRTLHLGLDLFVEPGTGVLAPLEGRVHSLGDNRAPLDYGPTLILEHRAGESGPLFYTLYGHLDPDSLGGLSPGQAVSRAQRIASVGAYPGNGGWAPHLHFQLILHLLGCQGDFPGVAPAEWRRVWLSLCPDPNLLLRIPALDPAPAPQAAAILRRRRRHTSAALSLAYREPLHIVRGRGAWLYDEEGRGYLDCVNNVAHVGHCHPRVVAAAERQNRCLNTNTRYLHRNLALYAERLTALFPQPLTICFLVCSGSEANELAIRLARAATGRSDFLVLEGAYHGNTSALVELSPYKFNGPGGAGAPQHVDVLPMPDPYRGRFRGAGAAQQYARLQQERIQALVDRGRPPAAFLFEPLMGCAGQIVPPPGYLSRAVEATSAAGGVTIADEVQIGFGRLGSHLWGFQLQGLVPDIVTLGKPIGNGYPLGAVLTTGRLAGRFENGMEYFNTFGGNPVAAAVGLAVLEVLEEERLQERALTVGLYLKEKLEALAVRFPLLGEVRGQGLFLGLELVRDRRTLEPASRQALYLVERMRELGILLSADGPLANVIKIKPPLVFSRSQADLLVDTLEYVLGEDPAQPDAFPPRA